MGLLGWGGGWKLSWVAVGFLGLETHFLTTAGRVCQVFLQSRLCPEWQHSLFEFKNQALLPCLRKAMLNQGLVLVGGRPAASGCSFVERKSLLKGIFFSSGKKSNACCFIN